jgi:hypothetical protein
MHIHELKTWPENYQPVLDGMKRAECRKNDRNFQPGDYVSLNEYDPTPSKGRPRYTGRYTLVNITHIQTGTRYGIHKDYAVFSFRLVASHIRKPPQVTICTRDN